MKPASSPRIRVLIVDDSATNAAFLSALFAADALFEVVGTADDGDTALAAVQKYKPHVVTMDLHMPRVNGFDATRQIMEKHPLPIVIVSGSAGPEDVSGNFHALEAGALTMVARPHGPGHPDYERSARELLQTVRLMSEVKVVRRWHKATPGFSSVNNVPPIAAGHPEVVAIGASTGGPQALQTILSLLRPTVPVPLLIVQHMARGFSEGFVEWLASTTGFPVSIAKHGEILAPGHAYMAPDDFHLGVQSGKRVRLSDEPAESGMKPSVSVLFRSVANLYGNGAVGVLLTGMGRDGVDDLKRLRDLGALTLVQNEESCVVYGMPGQAVLAGAADKILAPEAIAQAINSLLKA